MTTSAIMSVLKATECGRVRAFARADSFDKSITMKEIDPASFHWLASCAGCDRLFLVRHARAACGHSTQAA